MVFNVTVEPCVPFSWTSLFSFSQLVVVQHCPVLQLHIGKVGLALQFSLRLTKLA